jgi:membrane-associated HD superfamily phosphohydrolase
MMADAVEAAVRSLPEKSPQKIQAMVEKLVNKHFADGQLNECNLTLRDLSLVIESFVKILIGIYHQRVEYPESKATPLTLVTQDPDGKTDKNFQQTSFH